MPQFSKKANLVKELESVIQVRTLEAYLQFYLDAEDSFEDELDYYVAEVGPFEVTVVCLSESISNME